VPCRDRSDSRLEHQQAIVGARYPVAFAAGRQLLGIEFCGPGQRKITPQLQTEAHRPDAHARFQKVAPHVGTKVVGAFRKLARLLKRLSYSNLAEHFEHCALRRLRWTDAPEKRKRDRPSASRLAFFRHTYRSLLDETGAPIGVQQKLMRHSNVATTMNVYGNATLRAKQDANSKVVQMVMMREEPQTLRNSVAV
jgi:hypothetical protein